MLTEERHQQILLRVEENDIVTISELIDSLEASESTIRRDLQTMEDQGLLSRIHGGAKKLSRLNFEPSMSEKLQKFHVEKLAIAKYAAGLIAKEDVIYLDAGTTTIEMIPFIPNDLSVTVVTNSVKHASLLVDREIETIILGGKIKIATNVTLGHTAADQLQQFNFNKAFMGINGIHAKNGYTTPDPEEAAIKQIAMTHSQSVYVLADHSKLQQTTFVQVASLDAAEIIVDRCSNDIQKLIQQQTTITEVLS